MKTTTCKRLMSVAIILGSVLALWPAAAAAAPGEFAGGDGSTANPYQVANWDHLTMVCNHLGFDNHFILLNDLDSATEGYTERVGSGLGWSPLGNGSYPFEGSFDGQRYEIRDLFINRPTEDYIGLFGEVGNNGTIDAVALVDCDVTGGIYVGTITGVNRGYLSDCCASGTVVSLYDGGGPVGTNNNGFITTCYSTCSVEAEAIAGGLVAFNYLGYVGNCFAVGDVGSPGDSPYGVAGGLIGQNGGPVSCCFYGGGQVSGTTVGGLIGVWDLGGAPSVDNSYWDTQTTELSSSAGPEVGKTTGELMRLSTFDSEGWNVVAVDAGEVNPAYAWNIVERRSYPFLSSYQARFDLKAGWNMVSVPTGLPAGQNSPAQVFQGQIVAIYTWNPVNKSYTVPSNVEPDTGYWVAVTEDKVITKWL